MAKEGFIKLHRKILDWEWFKDPNTLTLFVYFMAKANHKAKRWQGQLIERGQLVTSFSTMSEETGLSVRKVRTALEHLESTGEVTRKTANKRQTITVENYNTYQGCASKSDKQSDNQTTTNKNDKNIKNKEYIYSQSVYMNNYTVQNALTQEETDRLMDIYSDLPGLLSEVDAKIKARQRQTEIKNPYAYIVRAAKDMEWPTVEEAKKKNAKRKKNQEDLEEAARPPEMTEEQKAKARELRKKLKGRRKKDATG